MSTRSTVVITIFKAHAGHKLTGGSLPCRIPSISTPRVSTCDMSLVASHSETLAPTSFPSIHSVFREICMYL